jgi:hypothetical protein
MTLALKAWPSLSAALRVVFRLTQYFSLPPLWGKVSARCAAALGRQKGGIAPALIALAFLIATAAPLPTTHAQPAPAEPLAGTSQPDSTYGEGGTKETYVSAANELRAEVWRDANRVIREQHEVEAGGDEFWGFFIGEGTAAYNWGGAIAVRPIGGPAAAWQMTVYGTGNATIKEYGFLTKAELDTEFAHWRNQMRGWVNGFIRAQQGNG